MNAGVEWGLRERDPESDAGVRDVLFNDILYTLTKLSIKHRSVGSQPCQW